MLGDFILESASAPGTSATVNLAGPPAGRRSFASVFATGVDVFYFMDDGTQGEWGMGIFTAGAPNTLTRTTVLNNTSGTTARLNFVGLVNVYNEIPSAKSLYINAAGVFVLPTLPIFSLQSTSTVTINASSNTSLFASGTMSVTAGGAATFGAATTYSLRGNTILFQNGAGSTEYARFLGSSFCYACTTNDPVTVAADGVALRPPGFSGSLMAAYRASGNIFDIGSGVFGSAFRFFSSGAQVGSVDISGSATAYNTTSDQRLKTNAEPLSGALTRLSRLPLLRFNWIGHEADAKVDGAFAHDVAAAVPAAVTGDKDAVDAEGKPVLQMVDWSKCMPLALAAIQEMSALAAAQQIEIADLRSRLDDATYFRSGA